MTDQYDLVEQISHDMGRSEMKRDVLRLIKGQLDKVQEEIHMRNNTIMEHEKQYPENTGVYRDDDILNKWHAMLQTLDGLYKQIFAL